MSVWEDIEGWSAEDVKRRMRSVEEEASIKLGEYLESAGKEGWKVEDVESMIRHSEVEVYRKRGVFYSRLSDGSG